MSLTSITLGNYYTNNNGVGVLGGAGGSGLDTQALIKGLVATQSTQLNADNAEITSNGAQTSALNTFQNLLTTFQTSAQALSNPAGVDNAADNVFDFTTGSVGNGGSAYVSVSTQPGASLQTYNISNITSIASAATQSSGVFDVASANADATTNNGGAYFGTGTINFNGASIQINSGDSLNSIASTFNSVSSTTGVTATVVSIDSTHYELSFTATNTGTSNNFDVTTATGDAGVLANVGLKSATHATTGTLDVVSADADATTNNGGAYFGAGTINFNGADITIHSGDSLNTIKAAFNAQSGTTGVTASVVNIGNDQYQLAFTSNSAFNLSAATDGSGVLANAGVTTTTSGTDANFELNGINITRQSNSVNDVINGVTFNILQTTPDGTTNYPVTISPDTTTVQNTINSFVSSYNAIQTFAATQTQLNANGTYASTAILANNQTFRQTMSDLNSQITAQVAGVSSGGLNSLAALGITFTTQAATSTAPAVSNILTVNDGQLTSELASNFKAVQNVFGFTFTSNNPNLTDFSHTNALAVNAFTLSANPVSGVFTATFDPSTGLSPVNFKATGLAGGGYTLTGPSGSVLDGLQLIYAGSGPATINVTATQGIADQMFNTSNAATTDNTGTIAVALTSLQTSDTSVNADITRQNQLIAQYQNKLTAELTALEQAISSSNSLLQSLNANQNAALVQAGQ